MRPIVALLTGLFLAAFFAPFSLIAQTSGDARGVAYQVEVYFTFAKSNLSAEAQRALDQVAAVFAQTPGTAKIRVSAHTDSVGSDARNMALSESRAKAVQAALRLRNIPDGSIAVAYFGERQPAVSNTTGEGRQHNRRAVVEVLTEKFLSKAPEPAPRPVVAPLPLAPSTPFSGQVKDVSGKGLQATVYFAVDGRRDSVQTDKEGRYALPVKGDNPVPVQVFAPGHFFVSTTVAPTPTGVEIKLDSAKVGDKLALQNLHFIPDDTVLMEESRPEMQNILHFMQTNPNLHVEISGHVSLESYMVMTPVLWRLSEDRAKLVYDYLVSNGIKAARMTHKGYGNTQMIFTDPSSENERRQNRRVEIRVLEH